MSSLTQQLDILNKLTEHVEKQIKTSKEQERLVQIGQLSNLKKLNNDSNEYIKNLKKIPKHIDARTRRIVILSTHPKFEALYEIIKKQDDRIKKLETLIEQLS